MLINITSRYTMSWLHLPLRQQRQLYYRHTHRHRDTERQRHRDTERQRDRERERDFFQNDGTIANVLHIVNSVYLKYLFIGDVNCNFTISHILDIE